MADERDLLRRRERRRAVFQTAVVALSAAFYLALVPVVVLLSGPLYEALRCSFGQCAEPGPAVQFVLPARGALEVGSAIRLPNGDEVGRISGFLVTGDERYTVAVGTMAPDQAHWLDRPIRCQGTANFNLQMDADLIISNCPDLDAPLEPIGPPYICGAVNHFEQMGQQLRRFVLEHVRPGTQPNPIQLSGPCGADNQAVTERLRQILDEAQ